MTTHRLEQSFLSLTGTYPNGRALEKAIEKEVMVPNWDVLPAETRMLDLFKWAVERGWISESAAGTFTVNCHVGHRQTA